MCQLYLRISIFELDCPREAETPKLDSFEELYIELLFLLLAAFEVGEETLASAEVGTSCLLACDFVKGLIKHI